VKYKDNDGKLKIYAYNSLPCIQKLPDLVPALQKMGIVKIGKVGMARSILAPARDLLNAMAEMLEKNRALNLCDEVSCLWCREAERKLGLYKKIDDPKFFQKNVFAMRIIALINGFRLNKFSFLSFRSGKSNWSDSDVSVSRILRMFKRIGWVGYLTFRRILTRPRTKQNITSGSWTIPLKCVCPEKPSNIQK